MDNQRSKKNASLQKPKGRKWRKALFLLLIAGLGGLGLLKLLEPQIEGVVERKISEGLGRALGGAATVLSVDLDILRLKGTVKGLRWENTEVNGPAKINIDEIELSLRPSDLIKSIQGELSLHQIRIKDPHIQLSREWIASIPKRETTESVSWKLDQLEIENGYFQWDDSAVPLDAFAETLVLSGKWNGRTRSLEATADANFKLSLESFKEPLKGPMSLKFNLSPKHFEIDQLHWSTAVALLTARAAMDPQTSEVEGEWELESDLQDLETVLLGVPENLSGKLYASGTLTRDSESWNLSGPATVESLRWGRLYFPSVEGKLVLAPSLLELNSLQAEGFGGRITGSLDWQMGRTPLNLAVQGNALRLDSLLRWFGQPLPFGSRGSVQATLSGMPDDLSTWSGEGTYQFRKDGRVEGTWPIESDGSFALNEGRVNVKGANASIASFLGEFELQVPLEGPEDIQLSIQGRTRDASRTQTAVLSILDSLDVQPGDYASRNLFGEGSVAADLSSGRRGTKLNLALSLNNGAYDSEPFISTQFEANLDRSGAFQISTLDFQGIRQRFQASIAFDAETNWQNIQAEADWITLDWLAPWINLETLDLQGGLKGNISLSNLNKTATGDLVLSRPQIMGVQLTALRMTPSADTNHLILGLSELQADGFKGGGRVLIPWEEGSVALELDPIEFSVESLLASDSSESNISGQGILRASLLFESEATVGELSWNIENLFVGPLELGTANGQARLDGTRIDWSFSDLDTRWTLAGNHELEAPHQGNWNLQWEGLNVPIYSDQDRQMFLLSTGTFSSEGKALELNDQKGQGEFASARLRFGTSQISIEQPVQLQLQAGQLDIKNLSVSDSKSDFTLEASIGLEDGQLDLKSRGRSDLSLISAWMPELRGSGDLNWRFDTSGPLDRLEWNGSIRLADGRLRLDGFPHRLDQLDAEANLQGNRLSALTWSGSLGGGDLVGGGTMDWSDGLKYAFFVRGERSRIAWPEGFKGVIDLDVRLNGQDESGVLSGQIDILRGEYREEFKFAEWFGLGVREYTGEETYELPEEIRLNLRVVGPEEVWFRNDSAKIETAVDLTIEGDLSRPEYSGRISLYEGGELTFRDVEYRILSGSLDFLGTEVLEPYINLVAETTVDRYIIRLSIDGTLDQFDYNLTSSPSLTQPDIIALLTTGQTLEDLSDVGGDSNLFSGDLVANYFAGALTDRFERQIQKITGIERVRINPLLTRADADPSASITLGKEVADDLFLVYSTELDSTERQLYQIEWQASRKFKLIAGRNVDGALGGEFLYFDRFSLSGKHAETERSQDPNPFFQDRSAGKPLGSINFTGAPDTLETAIEGTLNFKPNEIVRRVQWHELRERILAILTGAGHLSAQVEWFDEADADEPWDVTFEITPGPITQLILTGTTNKEAKRLLPIAKEAWGNAVRREDQLLEAEDAMRESMQSRGYFTADVYGQRSLENGQETVTFIVDRGKKVVVDEVTIEGATAVSEGRVRRQILTRKGNLFQSKRLIPETLEDDIRAIKNLYRDLGYLAVQIPPPQIRLSTDGEKARITIQIEEGRVFPLLGVSIPKGLPIPPAEALDGLGLELDKPFSPSALIQAEGLLRQKYDRRGYPETRVRASIQRLDEGVLVFFRVDPGPFIKIADIEYDINGSTNLQVVKREVKFEKGDTLSRAEMIATQQRLYKLGIFSSVSISHQESADGAGHTIFIRTRDAKPIAVTLGAGYDTEGDLKGTASISHENLFGADRSLGLQTRLSGDERLIQLTFDDPRGLGLNLPLRFTSGFERRDEVGFLQETRFLGFRLEAPWNETTRSFFRYNFQRVDLLDIQDPLAVREEKLDNIQLADVAYTLFHDSRDDPFSPTKGKAISTELQWFADAWGSDASFVKLTGAYSTLWPLPKGQSFASGIRLGAAVPFGSTTTVPLPERFFAGGDATLRGFERDQVGPQAGGLPTGGEALWLVNHEYRYPIWGALRGVLFYDAGNIYLELEDFDPLDLRHVLGTGLRLETPIGPLRLEYGHKLDRRTGESRGEWFLSIGAPF